jgi:carbonic anhydrase
MNRRGLLRAMSALALCPFCVTVSRAAEGPHHWSYEGETGPDKWAAVGGDGNACATGTQQSPVDITGTLRASMPRLGIAWTRRPDTIVNNGHTIQLNMPEGATLRVGNDVYKLVQFHFHHPSEHLINGKSTPMEVHFVHALPSGALGVVGIMIKAGRHNASFARIVATMPSQEGPPVKADAAIDPNAFLPVWRGYFRYAGSLTTPPCSETVAWMVLAEPIEVAAADIERFAKLFANNARPAQKLNRRFLLRS